MTDRLLGKLLEHKDALSSFLDEEGVLRAMWHPSARCLVIEGGSANVFELEKRVREIIGEYVMVTRDKPEGPAYPV